MHAGAQKCGTGSRASLSQPNFVLTETAEIEIALRQRDDPERLRGHDKTKTYNRRDSQMVTHSSTSRPVQCLCMAERTGCPVFTDLWSYVLIGPQLMFAKVS
jgi:hypothetical protein